MREIKIMPVADNFRMPEKANAGDACFDVFASRLEINQDGMAIVYLGFKTEIPEGFEVVVRPRSSLTKYGWVIPNAPGTIDAPFRGEWQVRFRPLPEFWQKRPISAEPKFPYAVGDAVAQIKLQEVLETEFVQVSDLSGSERGAGGFGSSGNTSAEK